MNDIAKQIEGVSERVLECAMQEFLAKGFMDASLRTITAMAGTSTSAIYVRFGDKAGLFEAIVEPVAAGLLAMFREVQETFHAIGSDQKQAQVIQYSHQGMGHFIDYVYEHFDVFRLLLDSSYGTKFHNFIDELTQIEVDYTYKYMESIGRANTQGGVVTEEFLHIVTTSYFEGVFEVVRHGMSKETAGAYIDLLQRYHAAGFDTFLHQ